ncbi:MAG: helix-turn-helix domain-containing protein [Halothece sp.]
MSKQSRDFPPSSPDPNGSGDRPSKGKYLNQFQRKRLEKALLSEQSELYCQRIQIMLLADEGRSQAEICDILECSQPTARYWIQMARNDQGHNWKESPLGRPKKLNEEHIERLKELVSHSPKEFGYPWERWTANWLSKHLQKEFGVKVTDRHINRLLKQMGLSTRRKPNITEKATDSMGESDRIQITNLNTTNTSELSDLWQFNPFQLG